jgi:hypothetical protein
MTAAPPIDSIGFFDRLAREMNEHPERFEPLGDVDLDLGIVMEERVGDPFRVRLLLEGIACSGVSGMGDGDEETTDCWLVGPLSAWEAMFGDIAAHGRATGKHTINSLALMADEIRLFSDDAMGLDKFSRFNQTIQEYLDGAASVLKGDAGYPGVERARPEKGAAAVVAAPAQ